MTFFLVFFPLLFRWLARTPNNVGFLLTFTVHRKTAPRLLSQGFHISYGTVRGSAHTGRVSPPTSFRVFYFPYLFRWLARTPNNVGFLLTFTVYRKTAPRLLSQGCFLVHRKRFELLAFGSVDQRSIQLS